MARQQLTGWSKFIDTALFGGAEQKTIAREQEEEHYEYLENYDGALDICANYQGIGYTGPCARCGGNASCNYSTLDDGSIICESCTDKTLERRGQDSRYLPWNQWKLPAGKRPIKLN